MVLTTKAAKSATLFPLVHMSFRYPISTICDHSPPHALYNLLTNVWNPALTVMCHAVQAQSLINKWRANTKPTPINTSLCEGLEHSMYPSVWSKPITQSSPSLSGSWSDSEIWHNTVSVNLMLIQCRSSCTIPFYIVILLSLTVYAHIHKQFHMNTIDG